MSFVEGKEPTRLDAIRAIGKTPHSIGIPSLINVLLTEPQPTLRKAAAISLGEIGATRQGVTSMWVASETNPPPIAVAIEALSRIVMYDEAPDVREAASNALGKIGASLLSLREAVSKQANILQIGSSSITRPLAQYIIPGLKAALHDEDPAVREMAARALQRIGTEEVLAVIEQHTTASCSDELQVIDNLVEQIFIQQPPIDKTQFSVYSPREVESNLRYGLFVYAYTSDMFPDIQQDVRKFHDELGGNIPKPKATKESAVLQFGTPITVMLECDELEFAFESITKKWRGNWIRFEFNFVPTPNLIDETLFVRVSIQIEGIEIAHIRCAIEVVETQSKSETHAEPESTGETIPNNPLAAAKHNIQSQTATMYSKNFISYSRKDSEVVRAYRFAQLAAGHEVFMDTESIHTGEDWQAALATAIDEADIFQLFWSEHSAASENVQHEWDYALKYKCPEDQCRGFIRPVYWKKPVPVSPPPELSHLNFRYVPLKSEGDSDILD